MNITKKLICILAAGATLGVAAPVFAEPWHDRGYDRREHYRDYGRHDFHGHDRRHEVVVERPYVVQRPYVIQQPYVVAQPVYYPAPAPNYGIGAMLGAAIGGYIDSQR